MERLPVDHMNEDKTDGRAQTQPDGEADAADGQPFAGEHCADLSPRHADVPQHAELAPPRQHERAE